ncbi:hypothetical protein [Acinetobacter sp. ANC 5378]|uniref:hypothetical protein n=1 Tax=Acinetobacter sp. ANC 5378 TaxID=2731249 RepID=UPI00148F6F05|nr:hypothetical protein [Acinetobacter sp. ANC 5378]NNG82825.1 hypothetical protein [Acinetobacter sp. ANC 5378]
MNQKREKIELLLALSSDLKFENNSISGTVSPVTEADVALISVFIERTFADDFTYHNIIPRQNEASSFRLNLLQDSKNYASYQSYIEHKFDVSKKVNLDDTDIIYENLERVKNGERDYIPELTLFAQFIRCLSDNYYQKNNVLIFFSKNYCEVPIQPRAAERYIELVKLYQTNDILQKSLKIFLDWIMEQKVQSEEGTEVLSAHKNELYVIIATEIIENLASIDKSERVFHLIKNVENIINDTRSKYSLYLDDFKYSKFIEKINKYADEFLVKVNKIISDLQTQVLAIPLAVSVITVFRAESTVNEYIYTGFLIYLFMVLYASFQQAYNLKHIEIQIKQFNVISKLPKELAFQWTSEIEPVNKKIFWHKLYLVVVSSFIGVLIGICILNIPMIYDFISGLDQIEFNLWVIVLLFFIKITIYVFDEKPNIEK